jgi:hypothetical protein
MDVLLALLISIASVMALIPIALLMWVILQIAF